jgi:nucleoside-diphosphate-sugar epimerase
VPLVFASSSSVYGATLGRPCCEDGPFTPCGGYAWSKIAAEQICRARAFSGGLVHTARLFTVLGEGQRPDMALPLWATAVAEERPVTVYGDLNRSRDFTDVEQAVDVLIRLSLLQTPTVVNVGTGVGQTVGALIDAIGRQLGRQPEVRLIDAPRQDPYATLADTTRLRRLVGGVLCTDLVDVVGRYLADGVSPMPNLTEGQLT